MEFSEAGDTSRDTLVVWSLNSASGRHNLCYVLHSASDGTFLATAHLDGRQVGVRQHPTQSDAIRVAVVVFERLTRSGWIVIGNLPNGYVH